MIAVDTNILVYAHRQDAAFHVAAHPVLKALAVGDESWAIPSPCITEFFSIVTNRKIYGNPSSAEQAIAQLELWINSPSFTLIVEGGGFWGNLVQLIRTSSVVAGRIHDARIAAICLSNGVRELLTADRDFSRFPQLKTRNPLIRLP